MVECSHVATAVKLTNEQVACVEPQKWTCEVCRSRKSPWICLTCGAVHCGRYVNGHAKKHSEVNPEHCLCMDQSLTVFCYKDDEFVVNDNQTMKRLRLQIERQLEPRRFRSSRSPSLDEDELPPPPKNMKLRARDRGRVLQNGRNFPVRTAGLQNLGNTCFMNVILQSLNNLEQFCCYFKKLPSFSINSPEAKPIHKYHTRNSGDIDISLVEEMRKVSLALWEEESCVYSPDSLFSIVWRLVPRFRGYQQQDAHEFMRYILDKLHSELAVVSEITSSVSLSPPPPSSSSMAPSMSCTSGSSTSGSSSGGNRREGEEEEEEEEGNNSSTIVSEIFGGLLQSDVTCLMCNLESTKLDPILDISLDIPERKRGDKAAPSCALVDCLSSFTDLEKLQEAEWYYCPRCKKKQPSTKCLSLHDLPNVLCIHLKRFRFTSFVRTKLNTSVSFPLHSLDMSPYTTNPKASAKRGRAIYDLAAVVVHHGSGVGCGHYTAYAFSPKSESWYHFNDSTVTETTPENVSNSHAYILFYVQRNINSKYSNNDATCSSSSSNRRSSSVQQSSSLSPSPSLALRTATGRLIRAQQSPTPFRGKKRSETITPT